MEMAPEESELSSPLPQWVLPPFHRLLEADFLLPLFFFFSFFRLAARYSHTNCWQDYTGFKQYRLRNLSVCLFHSFLSGGWVFIFSIVNTHTMLHDILHYYELWATILPIMSIGYFISDAIDMMQHELSRWTIELCLHHLACVIAFVFSILPHKFLLYSYWALLMEVNSVFLHIRTMMLITRSCDRLPWTFTIVKALNIITFVIFRFILQTFQFVRAVQTYNQYLWCYSVITLGGGVFFFLMNSILFYRIICADGLLGRRLQSGGDRDAQKFVTINGSSKQKRP